MKWQFGIYKVGDDVFGICKGAVWSFWIIDLQRPNVAYEILIGQDCNEQHALQKYYMKVREEIRAISSHDMIWLCRKELEFIRRICL